MQSKKNKKLTTLNFQTQNVWSFMEESAPEFLKTAVREAVSREAEKAGLPAPTFTHKELNAPKGKNTFAMLRAVIQRVPSAQSDTTAEEIERLLTKGSKSVQHTLRALLVELSNESETGVDSPGVAGAFYKVAAASVPTIRRRWTRIHTEQALRHIDVLLNNPTAATAKALIKYWDDPKTKDLKTDPFPAKPDPFAGRSKTRKGVK